jgi:hypothetical protein
MKGLVLLSLFGALAPAAELSAVHNVYLLPMSRGLDQYLANSLTNEKVFQVVTDPKLADAVFTDRIGGAFQTQLETMLPTPKSEAPPAEAKADPKKSKDKDADERTTLITETINKLDNPAINSSFARGKGTIFLVDVKSRQVIWSTFQPPATTAGKEMDRASSDVVKRLRKDMGLSNKKQE